MAGCDFYPKTKHTLLFLPRRGNAQRLLEYTISRPEIPVHIRSDEFGAEVDSQIGAYQARGATAAGRHRRVATAASPPRVTASSPSARRST